MFDGSGVRVAYGTGPVVDGDIEVEFTSNEGTVKSDKRGRSMVPSVVLPVVHARDGPARGVLLSFTWGMS